MKILQGGLVDLGIRFREMSSIHHLLVSIGCFRPSWMELATDRIAVQRAPQEFDFCGDFHVRGHFLPNSPNKRASLIEIGLCVRLLMVGR